MSVLIEKRLYLITPGIEKATELIKSLWTLNLGKEGVHILVKDPSLLELKKISDSEGILKTTDAIPSLIKGAIIGALAGFSVGLLLFKLQLAYLSIGIESIIIFSVFGILFGAWTSSLIGVSVPNPTFLALEEAAEKGEILLLVDLPDVKEKEVVDFVKSHHTDISFYEINR